MGFNRLAIEKLQYLVVWVPVDITSGSLLMQTTMT